MLACRSKRGTTTKGGRMKMIHRLPYLLEQQPWWSSFKKVQFVRNPPQNETGLHLVQSCQHLGCLTAKQALLWRSRVMQGLVVAFEIGRSTKSIKRKQDPYILSNKDSPIDRLPTTGMTVWHPKSIRNRPNLSRFRLEDWDIFCPQNFWMMTKRWVDWIVEVRVPWKDDDHTFNSWIW